MSTSSRFTVLLALTILVLSCKDHDPGENDGPNPPAVAVSLIDKTSSTLTFEWGEENIAQPWYAYLYGDAAGKIPLQEFDFPAGTFMEAPRFVIAGLRPGTKYYFKVLKPDSGDHSGLVEATTEDFALVSPTASTSGVIFAEDFGELQWEGDPVSGASGYRPHNGTSFSNGPETYVLPDEAPSLQLKDQTNALPASRLKGWVSESNAFIRPGAIELGAPGKQKGFLMTPPFSIPVGSNITVDITVEVATWSNTASNVWCIAALSPDNVKASGYTSDFDHHPSEDYKIKHFTASTPLKWQKITVSGIRLEDGDRIMIGPKASYKPAQDNDGRLLISSVVVTATGGMMLEDPLTFSDETKLSSTAQWPERRAEILDIFQREMYGQMPPAAKIYLEKLEEGYSIEKSAVRRQVRMRFSPDGKGPKIDWLIVMPRYAKGPVPVILTLNYYGNHTVLPDEEILLPDYPQDEPLKERGVLSRTGGRTIYPVDMLLARGYAFVTACYEDVSPDPDPIQQESDAYHRIFDLWGPRDPARKDNTTSLAAWAWALQRGVDMIGEMPELDASRIVLTGRSRLGKAALLASAFDTRFGRIGGDQVPALVLPGLRQICGRGEENAFRPASSALLRRAPSAADRRVQQPVVRYIRGIPVAESGITRLGIPGCVGASGRGLARRECDGCHRPRSRLCPPSRLPRNLRPGLDLDARFRRQGYGMTSTAGFLPLIGSRVTKWRIRRRVRCGGCTVWKRPPSRG